MTDGKMLFEDEVRRGAEALDAVRPGWELSIDPAELELSSCTDCVLGQVFGNYTYSETYQGSVETYETSVNGYDVGCGMLFSNVYHYEDAKKYGFNLPQGWSLDEDVYDVLGYAPEMDQAYTALGETWKNVIKERLDKGVKLDG